MKTTNQTLLSILLFLTISCKKETTIQTTSSINEISIQALRSDANDLVGAQAVRIGTQVWKIKDLATSYYRNGDEIPEVKDPNEWQGLITGAWCWYNDNPYGGKLYNWYAVADPRGLAPEGWHVPSDSEWTTLSTFLGNNPGGKMKEIGTTHWQAPNINATNISGFTALPGGSRNNEGIYGTIGYRGNWWSSTESDQNGALYCSIFNNHGGFTKGSFGFKKFGLSVRVLRN